MYFSLLESSKATQKFKNQFLEKIARHSLCVLRVFPGGVSQAPHKHWKAVGKGSVVIQK